MPARRKPVALHKLAGTYRKDRHGKIRVPNIALKPPCAPDTLSPGALKEWHRIVTVLGGADVLAETDRTILSQYCELYAQFSDDPKEFTASLHTQLRLIQAELGLTPASRENLPQARTPREESPFAEFD